MRLRSPCETMLRVHAGLGVVLVRQLGEAAAAQPHLREALRIAPEDVSCLTAFAESLVRTSHIAEAESVLDRALAIRPDDPTGLRLRGTIDLENGRPEDAIVLLERADRADPGNLETVAALCGPSHWPARMRRPVKHRRGS